MTPDNRLLKTMKNQALKIFKKGLEAVDPRACIHERCTREGHLFRIENRTYNLTRFKQIFVIGAGKAGASMALAIEEILGDRITTGMVIVKYGHLETLEKIKLIQAGHPIPDANGISAAENILKLAQAAGEKDLVICLISGGGSALMTLPAHGITLEDKQETTAQLLNCGATIHEINTIRKHISRIKGGQLATAVSPATMVSLILSDVVGDDLDTIASGPAVPDQGTFEQCFSFLEKYNIKAALPDAIVDHLKKGIKGLIHETPKIGDPAFQNISHTIIAKNVDALMGAKKEAIKSGYNTQILSSMLEGESRDIAAVHTAIAKEIIATGHPVTPPACVLSGGETTVTITGPGKGGRNQEFALACAAGIKGIGNVVILSAGTDGTDGPTDAAGAIVDYTTIHRADEIGLIAGHFLKNNNAYPFFDRLSDLIKTGPTNTNVMDLRMILIQ